MSSTNQMFTSDVCHSIRLIISHCTVSLLLKNPRGKSSRARATREREAASRVRGGRRAKRETAMVSYNDCEARHSGDGVILLVDDDAQLSAIFISDMRGEFEP